MVAKRQEVATPSENFNWASVDYQGAMARFPEVVSTLDILGDGFQLLEDKMHAVGKEFLILDWKFILDSNGNPKFVSLRAMTPNNHMIRINDGGTGIFAQIQELEKKGIHGGVICYKGLRVSEYDHPTAGPSKTFYLA